jgi:hypothetical protein
VWWCSGESGKARGTGSSHAHPAKRHRKAWPAVWPSRASPRVGNDQLSDAASGSGDRRGAGHGLDGHGVATIAGRLRGDTLCMRPTVDASLPAGEGSVADARCSASIGRGEGHIASSQSVLGPACVAASHRHPTPRSDRRPAATSDQRPATSSQRAEALRGALSLFEASPAVGYSCALALGSWLPWGILI